MHSLSAHVSMVFDHRLYSKDPMSSNIGHEIIRRSVDMMAEMGLDQFTFKKLAQQMGSTESTVYRYFQNKHQLAMYLASWHWSQLEWRIAFATANIDDAGLQLEKAIHEICAWVKDNPRTKMLNEAKLQRIVVTEGFNAFLPFDLSKSDKEGYLMAYRFLCERLSALIKKQEQDYVHPDALAALVINSIEHHMYLQLHSPQLTDIRNKEGHSRAILNMFFGTTTQTGAI